MSTESRIGKLETLLQVIAAQLGIGEVETRKTSARINSNRPVVTEMAAKSKGLIEDVVLENVGATRADGRMRLPAKMFGSRDKITVDGVKFHKLVSDQNRSPNFNPAILDAEVGDTITFEHEGGSRWVSNVTSGSRRKKGKTQITATKKAATPAPKAQAKGVKVSGGKLEAVKAAAKKFGLQARENAAESFQNENILEYTKFEDDPRQYLTSRENAQAKRIWKKQAGLTLKEWVELLSKEVYG